MSPTLLPSTTPELLGWLLQSTLCLGACWLLYRCMLQQERFFHYNRRFLQFTPWLALLLPRLVAVALPHLPTWWPAAANQASGVLNGGLLPGPTVQAAGSALYSLPQWLPLLYYAGVLALLLRLGGQVLHLWLSTRQLPREARSGYVLVHTGGQRPTSSFGRWVFWDETVPLTPEEVRTVLAHEIAHVRQGHTAEKLRLELVRALLWPVPFVHFFPKALTQVQEFMADAQALRTVAAPANGAPAVYSGLLARLALQSFHPDLPLTHSFTQSLTLTRIRMLTQSSPARRWKQWLLLPLGTALLAATAACEKAGELPPPPPPTIVADAALAPPPPPPVLYESEGQTPAGYPGGMTQLLADVMKRVKYPAVAKEAKVGGTVFVRFVVSEQGLIQDAEVMNAPKGPSPAVEALKSEALAAVKTLPGRWTPCLRDGKAVATRYTIPVQFSLK
ncbi:M56 family metallopeptidase [Hymenobacter sp. UYP22]|uniref:M56 family metallopeptidase n=1 Tax=Hymenobacter sp. UYP22 TaxID=3156348 RepID=UPI003395763B